MTKPLTILKSLGQLSDAKMNTLHRLGATPSLLGSGDEIAIRFLESMFFVFHSECAVRNQAKRDAPAFESYRKLYSENQQY